MPQLRIEGLTEFLSLAIFTAVLGMFQFGYNTGVINSPEENIEKFIMDTYETRHHEKMDKSSAISLFSLAVSIFAIGGMIGGFSGGIIANKLGRKNGLYLNNVIGVAGALLMGLSKSGKAYEMIFVGRFLIGVHCGLFTSIVPMFISEIAPVNLRGGLGTINQLAVTIGLFLSQVLGIQPILGTDSGWSVLLILTIIPIVLQTILLQFCPESPRYLLINKQLEHQAILALKKLRNTQDVQDDLDEIRNEERTQASEAQINMMQLVMSETLRKPLIIGIVLHLSQQLSGINAVFYYSTSLFKDSGFSEDSAKLATIGIGIIMVLMTLITVPLMDRAGRRTLQLYGLGGMFIFSIVLTLTFFLKEYLDWMSYLSVLSTLLFVMSFAIGPGSIPWMITSELFSQGPRPAAVSISVLVNWIANFIVGIAFPSMKNALENYTFVPFIIMLSIFWLFTYKELPETKNKTFEEISEMFKSGRGSNSGLVSERL